MIPVHRQAVPRLRAWTFPLLLAGAFSLPLLAEEPSDPTGSLESGWNTPPIQARLRAYWWWLNGQVTPAALTRDLEQMRAQGFGGALICDAGGAEQDGNDRVPHGPTFFTPEWRALYRHTLAEADRLGLELSLNIQSGWNLGGPGVSADDAAKKLVWTETQVTGPAGFNAALPRPKDRDGYYRDLFVVAYPVRPRPAGDPARRPLANWQQKAMHRALHFSAPDTRPLLIEEPVVPGEEDTTTREVLDLSDRLDLEGQLRWEVPPGTWQVLRLGCTVGDHAYVSTSSDGWKGYALDPLDAGAFRRYWQAVVEPLIADAGPRTGRVLKYLHTDSWEVEAVNWTPTLRTEFRKRRGYDFVPFLPVLTGRIVDNRQVSHRFLHDFRRTLGDLAVANHFRPFRESAHRRGLRIHPESGGPHAVPIDAQQCLGVNDVPMSEFWAWSWRHRIGESNRFFLKQPASAAHTYGRRLVAAEGFTTIGPHWQETLWDNLKPSLDRALCEGLNLLVWHAVVCSPAELGMPGIQYFAGTHFNPNTTWWAKSGPFLAYVNRCQWMLQQGTFVADALYYYGDHVPNFTQLRTSDPARVLPGYDYDVLTEEAILTRLKVRNGRWELPPIEGARRGDPRPSYRVLVLPPQPAISRPVLRRLLALVRAGGTLIGPRPVEATGLRGYPDSDAEVQRWAALGWGPDGTSGTPGVPVRLGRGRVFAGVSACEVLQTDGVGPDFDYASTPPGAVLDYIHRRTGNADLYFVANRSNRWETVQARFRVEGKVPELWDPVSGAVGWAPGFKVEPGRTTVPLVLPPFGSQFVVFREGAARYPVAPESPPAEPVSRLELEGVWTVQFDPRWGGPGTVEFPQLVDWTTRTEPGIRFYSGTATYRQRFELPASFTGASRAGRVWLDLGQVRELAEVRLNGQNLGIAWSMPFRVDVTEALRSTGNDLEIEVVNFWPNRIIGDAAEPPERRLTRTNIRKLTRETPLMPSGLLGPVRLLTLP